MERFVKLGQDMVLLWAKLSQGYLDGIRSTLILALVATVIGCVIGLICGILNTIPYTKNDPLPKRFLLKLIRVIIRVYVEVFRGTPMVLQAVFIYYGLPYFYRQRPPVAQRTGQPPSWWCPLTPVPTWLSPSGAASSPLIPARPRAPRPSA